MYIVSTIFLCFLVLIDGCVANTGVQITKKRTFHISWPQFANIGLWLIGSYAISQQEDRFEKSRHLTMSLTMKLLGLFRHIYTVRLSSATALAAKLDMFQQLLNVSDHYSDVKMSTGVSQITINVADYSTVIMLTAKQTPKPALLTCKGNPPLIGGFLDKGPVTGKAFLCYDVIMDVCNLCYGFNFRITQHLPKLYHKGHINRVCHFELFNLLKFSSAVTCAWYWSLVLISTNSTSV